VTAGRRRIRGNDITIEGSLEILKFLPVDGDALVSDDDPNSL
jgi:hypothetical protein